jgi:hypothetical protein
LYIHDLKPWIVRVLINMLSERARRFSKEMRGTLVAAALER